MTGSEPTSREAHLTLMVEYYQQEIARLHMAAANSHAREITLMEELQLMKQSASSLLDSSSE